MEPEQYEVMTAAAIARLASVGRAAVSNWRRRHPDFPKPAGGTETSPTFSRLEVEAWLNATGKADQLATAGRTETGTQRIALSSTAASPERFTRVTRRLRSRVTGFSQLLEALERERSIADLLPRDHFARSVAALLPRETVASRADAPGLDDAPVVLDPACGGAVMLMAIADRFGDQVKLAGQEINEGSAEIARFNLSSYANGAAYDIHVGDSLLDDQLSGYLGRAAAVVCEPPFDSPQWPSAELTTDPRWEFGIPAPRDAELAWVQHCYAHLRPRGVAIVAVQQRTCVQPSGEHIRGSFVRSGVLRAAVSLPRGMSSTRDTDICLWILQRPYGAPDRGPVHMIDLSRLGDAADVPSEFAAWQRIFDDADPTISRAVPRLELLDAASCLLPSRYVAAPGQASADDLDHVMHRLEELYARIGHGLPRLGAPRRPGKITCVTFGELERVGALAVRSRDATPRAGDVLLRTRGRPPVVASGTKADDTGIAQVVEIDETRLDPHFVATFLREDAAALPVANTLGAVNRDDLRRCRIPRMPLAEQRRYGDTFRRLHELDIALKALADLSGKVIDQAVQGLTSGAFAPDFVTNKVEESAR